MHALLTDQAGRTAAVDAWCQRQGRRPLRLVSTGKGQFKVYLEPVASEHQVLLGDARHASSAAVTFDPHTGEAVLGGWQRELLRASASEHVIHDWKYITRFAGDPAATSYLDRHDRTIDDGAAKWLAHKSLLGTLRYDQAESLLALPVKQSDSFRRGLDMANLASHAISSRSNKIVRHRLRFAIGIVHARGRPCMLMAEHDSLAYCYENANAAGKQACVDLIRAWYKTPEPAVQRLYRENLTGPPATSTYPPYGLTGIRRGVMILITVARCLRAMCSTRRSARRRIASATSAAWGSRPSAPSCSLGSHLARCRLCNFIQENPDVAIRSCTAVDHE